MRRWLLWFLCFFAVVLSVPMVGSAQEGVDRSDLATSDPETSEEQFLLDQAKSFFDLGNNELALSSLEQFLLKYPDSVLLPDVYLQLTAVYISQGSLKRSIEVLKTFLDQFPGESRTGQVRLMLSDIYFDMGAFNEVLSFWKEIPGEEISKSIVYERLAAVYSEREDYINALKVLMEKRKFVIDPLTNELVRNDVTSIIRNKLGENELQSVVRQFKPEFPADEAMIRLIEVYNEKGDYYREGREIKQFVSLFPMHPFVIRARNLLDALKEKIKSERFLIAVFLPLSGRLAPFGNTALKGIELALQLFKEDLPGASVGLVVKDLKEAIPRVGSRRGRDPFQAAIKDWLDEYRPVAVIGPLLSKEVNRIAPIVEKAGLPLITPAATARHLVSMGNAVFRNAVTNRFLCRAIAEYAVFRMSMRYFAIFFPRERIGKQWVNCFTEAVTEMGGEVIHAESYPLNDSDFSGAILRLKKADLAKYGDMELVEEEVVEEVEEEVKEEEIVAEADQEGDGEKEKVKVKREVLYIPGIDAIFLPGDAKITGLIIPQLLFHGFEGVTLLGSSGWNSPEFLNLVGSYAEGSVFADGFFKDSDEPIVQQFVRQYQIKYQEDPDIFAAQAFDAARIILTALRGGALSPPEIKEAIGNMSNFSGVSGFIYEVRDGEMIKKPYFIEVKNKRFSQVN
ncbi:MAG: ABC transporter substrate-binding protein [Nitrospiria bacterium]